MNDVMYSDTMDYMEMELAAQENAENYDVDGEPMEEYGYGTEPEYDCKCKCHDKDKDDDCKCHDKDKDDCKCHDKDKDDDCKCHDKDKDDCKCHDKDKDHDCDKKHDKDDKCPKEACRSNFFQKEKICVPVKITPHATPGEATVTCCGKPVVMNGNHCKGDQSYCMFTVTQALCIEIPIAFGALVETGIAVVECGMAGTEPCDCR